MLPIDTNKLPAPDNLAGWKAVEHALNDRISDRLRQSELITQATLRQYLGCKDEDYFVEEYGRLSFMHAFIEWLVNDFRPTSHSGAHSKTGKKRRLGSPGSKKTLAEKMLAAGLPAAEAAVLESITSAYPSIYIIQKISAGQTLTVEDLILGGERLIHDKLLSGCVECGQCLTGRVVPVGQFHFFTPLGPPLPNRLAVDAVEYLKALGVELTAEGLRRGAIKFGRLWAWFDDQMEEDTFPQLRNSDGEELVLQTASFKVGDEKAVRDAFRRRADIDYDEEEEVYEWFREQDHDAILVGDTVMLGHMRFVVDELILEVNSEERLQAARRWLEAIPGVVFQGARMQTIDPDATDIPPDDRIRSEPDIILDPAVIAQVQESFREHYMKWLDMSLPMLQGKSPRQVCKTEEGRKKIAMLIRSIPMPVGNIQIEVPRDEMLREIGLATQVLD